MLWFILLNELKITIQSLILQGKAFIRLYSMYVISNLML